MPDFVVTIVDDLLDPDEPARRLGSGSRALRAPSVRQHSDAARAPRKSEFEFYPARTVRLPRPPAGTLAFPLCAAIGICLDAAPPIAPSNAPALFAYDAAIRLAYPTCSAPPDVDFLIDRLLTPIAPHPEECLVEAHPAFRQLSRRRLTALQPVPLQILDGACDPIVSISLHPMVRRTL